MRVYIFIAAIAGGVTWLVTPLVRHIAIRWGAVGEVRSRDVHTVPTPRMGGLAMLIGLAAALLFASRLPFVSILFQDNNVIWVVLLGAFLVCLLGIIDDIADLDWMLKMAGQLLISVLVSVGGLQIVISLAGTQRAMLLWQPFWMLPLWAYARAFCCITGILQSFLWATPARCSWGI